MTSEWKFCENFQRFCDGGALLWWRYVLDSTGFWSYSAICRYTQVETEKYMRKVYIKLPQKFFKSISLLDDKRFAEGRKTSTIANKDDWCFMKISVFFQHFRYLAGLTCIDSGASIYISVWTKWAYALKHSERIEGMPYPGPPNMFGWCRVHVTETALWGINILVSKLHKIMKKC